MAVSASDPAAPPAQAADWHPDRRVAFRVAFLYFLLYHLPATLTYVPGLNAVIGWFETLWQGIVPWFGAWVLHVPIPADSEVSGNGDT
jgi:hypothetical protein